MKHEKSKNDAMRHELDHIDAKILNLLRENARMPLKEIAEHVFLSSPAVSARIERLEKEGVGLDLGAYRDAPAGLRIWCGSTVETADVQALLPWIEWAFDAEIAAQA